MNNKTVRILAVAALVLSLASCGVRDADEGKETEIIINMSQTENMSEADTFAPDTASGGVVVTTGAETVTPAETEASSIQTEPVPEPMPVETLPPETAPVPVETLPPETEAVPVETLPHETEPTYIETVPPELPVPAGLTVVDGVTYVNGILVVNKTYALPEDYNPGPDPNAENALALMFKDAAAEGLSLWVRSGVRTYIDQKIIYNNYVNRDGKALADTYSARPGHSEHQSGLGFDINSIYKSFADTAEGQWLAANCHRYGFIIRYPAGKEHITGYMYEPWHVRYLGVDVATAVYESGLCLEEYLGVTSAYAD